MQAIKFLKRYKIQFGLVSISLNENNDCLSEKEIIN